ncbi:hypothetical protein NPIL_344101 [Nephila pilipes]|uniref:CCHC-type domain-containing protein n=1 Tax=Nephila pilipes TaxID=299642 RepID=A0A8X6UUC9_NEPPI|nr:hypothetical protein NPIL_344101 [Nephila pilipes]
MFQTLNMETTTLGEWKPLLEYCRVRVGSSQENKVEISNFAFRKSFDKQKDKGVKRFACFSCGSDKHLKRDCPRYRGWETKRVYVNSVLAEKPATENETAKLDFIGEIIPREAIAEIKQFR